MDQAENPRDIDDVRSAVAESPEFEELRDASSRRRALYRLMAENPDPLWREMGQQLRDGRMRPAEMLSTPEYREHLRAGMADGLARFAQLVGVVDEHLRAHADGEPSGLDAEGGAEGNPPGEEVEDQGPILRRR
ncbi:hypothetical protein B0I33_10620 [Prauserella shujinwangii]|uniref:Uncharacterized protein n=1 Tax=Prauserella shujinwangii TaxID=1453103 RepID=A0A2T0LT93_9PSEU|nr:hypothetical protein [Prauserella shujinwangii]PRX46923.1 hypothetical protein B0I33_10620 [Prauserella shujinwangii]